MRRVPQFVALPRIPTNLPAELKTYLENLHAVLRQLIEPLSELGGRTSVSLDDHITNTNRDDHLQYLNITRHDTTTRHPLGSVIPVGSAPPNIAMSSSAGVQNSVARSDHTHGHGDLSGLGGTHHDWEQISGKPTEFTPEVHDRTKHTHALLPNTAPTQPVEGDIWYDSAQGQKRLRYRDNITVRTVNDWDDLFNKPTTFPPSAHASTHERDGSDVVKASRLYSGLDEDKPSSENTEGDVWWATDTDKLYVWDGASWKEIGGGGSLTMFTGIVSKDYDPPSDVYGQGWNSLITYDVGENGWLQPVYLKLPVAVIDPVTGYSVKPGVRFHYHDETYIEILNSSTTTELIKRVDDLVTDLMPTNKNGTSIRKIEFGAFTQFSVGDEIDLDVFQIRAYAHARGTGGAL